MHEGPPAGAAKVRVLRPASPRPPAVSRSPNFDRDAARLAWRQVARVRGAGPNLGQRPARLGWLWWVGAVGFVVIITWWGREPERPEVAADKAAVADRRPAETPDAPGPSRTAEPSNEERAPSRGGARPRTTASMTTTAAATPTSATISLADRPPAPAPAIDPRPDPAPEPEAAAEPTAEPEPPPVVQRPGVGDIRRAPSGASEDAAAAFIRIPKARDDRRPVGGIAGTGLHVDRMSLGTEFDRGECRGSKSGFSTATHDYVHFCFRVVHQRQVEYVLVKWERAGSVVRRAWVRIPDDHAYRTRAGLSLRKAEPGRWTVRVESGTGVELASSKFEIQG